VINPLELIALAIAAIGLYFQIREANKKNKKNG
jgi:hypothetical protein